MDATRIGRTPRIGRLHPPELEAIDPELRGDAEPVVTATIEPDVPDVPDEDDPKLRARRVGDKKTLLPIDVALAKLEAVAAADRARDADRLAALRATFDDDVGRASEVIAECEAIQKEFDPIQMRANAFLASVTWERLFASAPQPTRKRADDMQRLLHETAFLLASTVRVLRSLQVQVRNLPASALDHEPRTSKEEDDLPIREVFRRQWDHPDVARENIAEVKWMLTNLAEYVARNVDAAPEIAATIIPPAVLDHREALRPTPPLRHADGEFDPRD